MQKMSLDIDLISFAEISLRWLISLNVKHKIIKLLENNILGDFDGCGFHNDFLDTGPKAWSMKKKIKLDFIKIKICSARDIVKKVKTSHIMGENIIKAHI